MRLFKKTYAGHRRPKEWESPWLEAMAAPIAGLGRTLQKTFAGCLSRLTGKLSPKRLQTALVVFCVLCGGFSTYLVVTATLGPNAAVSGLPIQAVQTPKHLGKASGGKVLPNPFQDVRLARQIRAFRLYRDSLRKTGGGMYDSMLADRPRLIDSLTRVENRYSSQPLK